MLRKKCLLILLSGLFVLVSASTSYAQMFSISVGTPLSQTISDADVAESDGVSGFMGHVKLPVLIGLGVEMYDTKFKDSEITMTTQMMDVFYMLPIPFINISLGLGLGTSVMNCSACSDAYETGTVSQFYGQVGIPIAAVFDVHLSYHNINNKVATKNNTAISELDLSGTMIGAGVSFGF